MASLLLSRAVLDRLLALGGAVVIVVEFLTLDASPFHIPVIALGALMVYLGLWRLTGRLIYKRVNKPLRADVNHFISLVRQLSAQKSGGDAKRIAESEVALREMLDRIIAAA
ncbi:MAG: hypothetical protein JSV86_14560 [Gemmatimonadota bacterium]|nr:MAG: hypothetical protein JSV86_14560 [Gemmatimonadota bacterium]